MRCSVPRVIGSEEAAACIQSNWTIATSGFTGCGHPETLTRAIRKRYLRAGSPAGLTLVYAAGQGDRMTRGVGHLAEPGLLRKVIGGHWAAAPRLGELAHDEQLAAYNLPQGVIVNLFRAIASGKPGVVTSVGLDTFVDPRHDGGRLNASATESVVELLSLGGQEYLYYPAFRIDCALIRATTADCNGNLSCEEEAFPQDVLELAQAARNSGGIVIAQVKRVLDRLHDDPTKVRVPGILVDYLVLPDEEVDHWQTYAERFNPAYVSRAREEPAPEPAADPFDVRKVIQRRAALELPRSGRTVVNLGVGLPAGVGRTAGELGIRGFVLTVESGPVGGVPADARSFGASAGPEAILSQSQQFDFYDGGGLDLAFLGMAQVDAAGSVNVSRFGRRIAGVGGFINISQAARALVFMGTFSTGGLQVETGHGRLRIAREGRIPKVVERVDHLSFNGSRASSERQRVLYVTERAVFTLEGGRLTLVEVAPGIDVDRDVLAHLPETVAVSKDLAEMNPLVFTDPSGAQATVTEAQI